MGGPEAIITMSVSSRHSGRLVCGSYAGFVLNEDEQQKVEQALAESNRSAGIVFLPGGREDAGSGIYG
jgi:hypothetical protein